MEGAAISGCEVTDKKPSCFVCSLNPWLVKAALLFGLAGPILGGAGIYAGTRDEGPKTTKAIVTVLTPQGMWVTFTPTPTEPVASAQTPVPYLAPVWPAERPVDAPVSAVTVITVLVPADRVNILPAPSPTRTPMPVPASVPVVTPEPVCIAPPGWQRNGKCP